MTPRSLVRTLIATCVALALCSDGAAAKDAAKKSGKRTPAAKAGDKNEADKDRSGVKPDKNGCPPAKWVKKSVLPASVPGPLSSSADYLGVSYSSRDTAKPDFAELNKSCGGSASRFVAYDGTRAASTKPISSG